MPDVVLPIPGAASTYAPLGTLVAHGAASPVPANFELDGAGLAAYAAEYAASAHHRRVQRALTTVPLAQNDGSGLALRVLVDRSVVEAYAQRGRAHIANRAYPSEPSTSTGVRIGWRPVADVPSTAMADLSIWPMQQGMFPIG